MGEEDKERVKPHGEGVRRRGRHAVLTLATLA
jgi:hypothetical protein